MGMGGGSPSGGVQDIQGPSMSDGAFTSGGGSRAQASVAASNDLGNKANQAFMTGNIYAGIALKAAGAVTGYRAHRKAGEAQARGMRDQAAALREQAAEVMFQADLRKEAQLVEKDKTLGEIGSKFAKAGVDVGAGSPAMVQEQSAAAIQQQITNDHVAAQRQARMLEAQARKLGTAADSAEKMGKLRGTASLFGDAGSILVASQS
jgi:hypothetical protein